tara:strand:+ start:468 stop:641 length:174 start_codon:yes stop_codon:yes gene_type:complete
MSIEILKEFMFSFVLMLALIVAAGVLLFSIIEPRFKEQFALRTFEAIRYWRKTWFGR